MQCKVPAGLQRVFQPRPLAAQHQYHKQEPHLHLQLRGSWEPKAAGGGMPQPHHGSLERLRRPRAVDEYQELQHLERACARYRCRRRNWTPS